jgi:hypothetical protein
MGQMMKLLLIKIFVGIMLLDELVVLGIIAYGAL